MYKFSFIFLMGIVISSLTYGQNVITQAEFSESGLQRLEVRGSFFKVLVEGSPTRSTVDFKGELIGRRANQGIEIKYNREGNTMKVWIERPKKLNWNMGNTRATLTFKVPASIDLMVDNSSGSLEVSGIISEKTNLKTSSGSIRARDIKANTTVRSSSGSIKMVNLEGNVLGKSSSGGQRWENIRGDINTEASSGSIRFAGVQGSIEAETSSGGISLDNVTGSLKLKASSGSLRGNQVNIKANSVFHTSSGGISMNLVNSIEELSFDLSASSGGLTVGDKRGRKRMYVERSGGILIKGTSNSGSQRYN